MGSDSQFTSDAYGLERFMMSFFNSPRLAIRRMVQRELLFELHDLLVFHDSIKREALRIFQMPGRRAEQLWDLSPELAAVVERMQVLIQAEIGKRVLGIAGEKIEFEPSGAFREIQEKIWSGLQKPLPIDGSEIRP